MCPMPFNKRAVAKARSMQSLCLCLSLRDICVTQVKDWPQTHQLTPSLQNRSLLYHTGKLRHLSFSSTARAKMGKSIYCSSLLVTDNQNYRFFKQEDTLEIIQCGGFPNI